MGADLHILHGHSSTIHPRCDVLNVKPGLDRAFLKGLVLCFPVAFAIWAGIIYGASRLAR